MKEDSLDIAIGERLRKFRKLLGMNQEDVADYIGLTRTSICNIEVGRQSLSVKNIALFCALYGCTPNDIFPPIPKAKKQLVVEMPTMQFRYDEAELNAVKMDIKDVIDASVIDRTKL